MRDIPAGQDIHVPFWAAEAMEGVTMRGFHEWSNKIAAELMTKNDEIQEQIEALQIENADLTELVLRLQQGSDGDESKLCKTDQPHEQDHREHEKTATTNQQPLGQTELF